MRTADDLERALEKSKDDKKKLLQLVRQYTHDIQLKAAHATQLGVKVTFSGSTCSQHVFDVVKLLCM